MTGITWSYGVTAVKQRLNDGLLDRTLASLQKAGFDKPRLFIDGDVEGFERLGLEITARAPSIRAYGNWLLGLTELYIRHPCADRYAMFQDDFVTCRNLRSYLEKTAYPDRGYLNLYTFPHNQPEELAKRVIGGISTHPELRGDEQGFYRSCQNGKGAVALVFDNPCVRLILSRPHMYDRILNEYHRRDRAIDGVISESLRQEGWTEYVHNPSLVQHTGLISSMGNGEHLLANSFMGEDFDLLSLLPREVK